VIESLLLTVTSSHEVDDLMRIEDGFIVLITYVSVEQGLISDPQSLSSPPVPTYVWHFTFKTIITINKIKLRFLLK
jgi:hypothetical protein